jgi:hypothetical protein
MYLPWSMGPDWPVSTSLYFKLSSIIHGITTHCLACGMPHGLHCPRPRSIINLNQGFKETGGPNATWEGLHPSRLHNLRRLDSGTVRSVYSSPWIPHLIALRRWHARCTLTLTSSWLWSVGAWFESLEQSWSNFYFRSRSGIGWLRFHKATILDC